MVGREGLWDLLAAQWRAERPVALAEVVDGPAGLLGAKLVVLVRPGAVEEVVGSLGDPDLDRVVARDAAGELAAGLSVTRHYGVHGEARGREVEVFIESFAPPPQMIIFGAVDFTAALGRVGKLLGYRVTVCDARPVFTTRARFPMADEVVVDWPHRWLPTVAVTPRTVLCVLTHDPKFDVPLLEVALRTEAGYIGAMGSRRTHDDRMQRLREAGLTEAELARLRSPIGLDLGARTPEETALSIAAEIVSLRWGGSGSALTVLDSRIHHDVHHDVPAGLPA